jgi:hypothetical protein
LFAGGTGAQENSFENKTPELLSLLFKILDK